VPSPDRFRLAACLSRFNPSRASRFAVLTPAAARDAFFARAERSSGVMFLADALPPCRPNMRSISADRHLDLNAEQLCLAQRPHLH